MSALDCWGGGRPGVAGLALEPGGPSLKHMGYTPTGYSTAKSSYGFEFPEAQKAALRSLVKTPLVYANVALRNWMAFH